MDWNDETLIYCGTIFISTGILLGLYHFYVDPNKDIERHYFKNNKIEYSIYKLAYMIIFFSCIFSIRYIIYELFSFMSGSSKT
jgi:hypothetical protein